MGCRVCELVFLVPATFNIDKDPQIIYTRRHPNTGSCEFCTQLVKSASWNAFDWTVNVEGWNRRVVWRLFGYIGNPDQLIRSIGRSSRGSFLSFLREWRCIVRNVPITLMLASIHSWAGLFECCHTPWKTPPGLNCMACMAALWHISNGYVRTLAIAMFSRPPTTYEILCKPETKHL